MNNSSLLEKDPIISERKSLILNLTYPPPDTQTTRPSGCGEENARNLIFIVGAIWLLSGIAGFMLRFDPASWFLQTVLQKNISTKNFVYLMIIWGIFPCFLYSIFHGLAAKYVSMHKCLPGAIILLLTGIVLMSVWQFFLSFITLGLSLIVPFSMLGSRISNRPTIYHSSDSNLLRSTLKIIILYSSVYFFIYFFFKLDWRVCFLATLFALAFNSKFAQASVIFSARLGKQDPSGIYASVLTMTFSFAFIPILLFSRNFSYRTEKIKRLGH